MRQEMIRANPKWRNGDGRFDCIFVSTDQGEPGMKGLTVARVRAFFSFTLKSRLFECALVHWFEKAENAPDRITGLWKVGPEYREDGTQNLSVIHVDAIFRAAHLMPVYTSHFTPATYAYTETLDNYSEFFVNRYIDHHAHEFIF